MRLNRTVMLAVAVAGISTSSASAQVLLDRFYRMGDSPDGEGASAGSSVSSSLFGLTFDDAFKAGQVNGLPTGEAVDLFPTSGSPTYASITGRPDGQGGLGIRFDGNDALSGARLGLPADSFTSVEPNSYDLTGIADRGLQAWVNVDAFGSTALQTIVADTNQHGLQINESGNFAMLYAGESFDSGVDASGGGWFHAMVVRPEGAAGGSRLYINGEAVAFAPGGYNGADNADLVVGGGTVATGEPELGAEGDFFSGIVDDLKLFVIGDVTSAPDPSSTADPLNIQAQTVQAFTSEFDLAVDNDFISFKRTEATGQAVAGDLNLDGVFDGHLPGGADRAAFTSGWFSTNELSGAQLGDLSTFQGGDLNFDGVTDIVDLVEFQSLIAARAGGVAISAAELAAVPEPAATCLAAMTVCCGLASRRRPTATTARS